MQVSNPENIGHAQVAHGYRVNARCPYCRREGTLDSVAIEDLSLHSKDGTPYVLGVRRCPAADCGAFLFFTRDGNAGTLLLYPPETIDFDTDRVPDEVVAAMGEAITCHANECYTAAAIMVRKTIEEICREKQATGKTLFERIENLSGIVTLPKPFLKGLHNLRMLGNDAAHVEAEVYDGIGEEETRTGIEVAKEFIHVVYQFESVMDRLEGLKGQENETE